MADLPHDLFEALDWARRIADPEFADWDEHLAWLEADPSNVMAFDAALLLMAEATENLGPTSAKVPPRLEAVNDDPAPWTRRFFGWIVAGSAIAAAVIGVIVLRPGIEWHASSRYMVTTANGQRRSIMLSDGSELALNGGTRVKLDRADPRSVTLVDGQVFATVRHDDAHPFVIKTDRATFQDVGTSFDVRRGPKSTEIQVHDGVVLFNPGEAAVRLTGGQAMVIAQNSAEVRSIDPTTAGSWRSGRLTYNNVMISVVAADLQRTLGVPVGVDESIASRQFSGVILLDDDHKRLFERIGVIMNVVVEKREHGWRLKRNAG